MKSLLFFALSLLIIFQINAQPYQLEGDFGSGWSPHILESRGAVLGVTVQATATNATNGFLFNNPSTNYTPKWCGSNAPNVSRPVNTLHTGGAYYYNGGGWDANLEVPVTASNYYTFIIDDNSTSNNDLSILETTYNPNDITNVTVPGSVNDLQVGRLGSQQIPCLAF
mgnify:CR=1 FL=1